MRLPSPCLRSSGRFELEKDEASLHVSQASGRIKVDVAGLPISSTAVSSSDEFLHVIRLVESDAEDPEQRSSASGN